MSIEASYLIDTNILLRLSKQDDPNHDLVQAAIDALTKSGAQLYYTAQNISEFWNVCTRPAGSNGFGLSIKETDARVQAIELIMTLLPDSELVYRVWREIVVRNNVSGAQVHDARLAAAMKVHGISHILTLNQPDFARYSEVNVVHPHAVRF
jgi:predicted nucleic acid-binding protein